MENQNVLGTIEKGGRNTEHPRKSKEVQQHREKIICNSGSLSGMSSVATVDIQRDFKLAALKMPGFVNPHCSVWSEPFLGVREFCRTHSP